MPGLPRMFESVPTGRWIAVALGLLCRVLAVSHDAPPEPDWYYGVIMPNSLQKTGNVYRFTLRYQLNPKAPEHLEVIYAGELPSRVCAGQDTFLTGVLHGNILTATDVHGPGCTKGNDCRRSACLPDEERPPECRRSTKFE